MSSEQHHQTQQAALKQAGYNNQHAFGYCTVYNAKTRKAKFIIPMLRDADDNPLETNWIDVGSPIVGNGWGLHFALKGGATSDNLPGGEKALINVSQRSIGLYTVSNLCFNTPNPAPGAGTDNEDDQDSSTDTQGEQGLQGGEFILKHESGSFLKFYKNGDVRVFVAQTLYADVTKDLNVTVETGNVTATVKQGDVTLDVQEGDASIYVEQGDMTVEVTEGDFSLTAQNITMTAQNTATLHGIQTVNVQDGP